MNFLELKNAVAYIQKHCPCLNCKSKHRMCDINIMASTHLEGLFELKCGKCDNSTIITIVLEPREKPKNLKPGAQNTEQKISKNDVVNFHEFLSNFDGNFKKIFDNNER